jgi:hypothetical protein
MKKILLCLGLLGTVLVSGLLATPANAQATRTWVSGVGDDVNPCSRTAPCKTFAGAISKTATGGAINCIDAGAFGAVTITKSISIICDGFEAGVLASGTNGIIVNNAAAIVYLRGLDIQGANTGLAGIRVFAATSVFVDNCVIHDFKSAGTGWGIQFTPNVAAELTVSNTKIYNNGDLTSGGTNGGAILVTAAAGQTSKVLINNTESINNFFGFKADGTGGGGGSINMAIRDSYATQNFGNGIVGTTPAGGATILMMLDRATSTHNAAGFGVIADGAGTTIRMGNSTVSGNANGVGASGGGILQSYKNNMVNNNTADGTPITVVPGGINGLN